MMSTHRFLPVVLLGLSLLTGSGCSSKTPVESPVTRVTGQITDLEFVDRSEVEQQASKSSTRISASVSSGGGISIGLGILLPLLSGEEQQQTLVRYTVKLNANDERVIYHTDQSFIIGDCIDIIETEGSKAPPRLALSADTCADN